MIRGLPQIGLVWLLSLADRATAAGGGGLDVTTGPTAGWPVGWIIGLACGVGLMIAFDIDWHTLPQRARLLVMALRRKSRWALLAVASLGVILFY